MTLSFKIKKFLDENKNLPTPFVVFDTDILERKYQEFTTNFPKYDVFYAVKCNPAKEIIAKLDSLGSKFDVASIEEIDLCLSLGIDPKKMSWGSTIKKSSLIKDAYIKGINLFAIDSIEELEKVGQNAPNSKVYCRIMVSNDNALWPLSAKFGCSLAMAEDLLTKAKDFGVIPYGISFHVGSQQLHIGAWEDAIKECSIVFNNLLEKHGIELQMVNIGGGYPAYGYTTSNKPLSEYQESIHKAFQTYFPKHWDKLYVITEPGRFLVADAGVLKTEVVLVSKKDEAEDIRWVYLDIGMFGGLAETMGECIKYKIITTKDSGATGVGPVALAGPTCDGADVMYKNYKYLLPMSLKSGDEVYILSTGAYTTSYSSVGFNGFKPLKDYYI